MSTPEYLPYLETLRRLPDDVVLDMATREFDMVWGHLCLCGWAMRAALSRANGKAPDEFGAVDVGSPVHGLVEKFGGTVAEWSAIYWGVTPVMESTYYDDPLSGHIMDIELAFVYRVEEACGR